jgi:hypothetical protein
MAKLGVNAVGLTFCGLPEGPADRVGVGVGVGEDSTALTPPSAVRSDGAFGRGTV